MGAGDELCWWVAEVSVWSACAWCEFCDWCVWDETCDLWVDVARAGVVYLC